MKVRRTKAGGKIPPTANRKAEAKTAKPKGGGVLQTPKKRALEAKAWRKA